MRSAARIVPMLLDFAMMPARVRFERAVRGVVLEVLAAAHQLAGDPERRVGVGLPLVHDGRQRHELARRSGLEHVRERAVPAVRVGGGRGLVGIERRVRCASARISPVRGSITTMVPLSAWDCATRFAMACCATYWMSRSRVSRTVVPVVASVSEFAPGRDHPTAGSALERLRARQPPRAGPGTRTRSRRGRPPSLPTKPTTFAARSPAG